MGGTTVIAALCPNMWFDWSSGMCETPPLLVKFCQLL